MTFRSEPDDTLVRAVRAEPEPPTLRTDPADEQDLIDDEDYQPQPARRWGRLTVALVVLLIAAVGVFAGVQLQRALGSAPRGGGAAAAGGSGGAGYPGRTRSPGADASGVLRGGTPTDAPTDAPAVVGKVSSLKDETLLVTDFGGRRHRVKVSSSTVVTTPYGTALKAGVTVAVSGRAAPDGSVTATAITVR